jgi:hypothetical protein
MLVLQNELYYFQPQAQKIFKQNGTIMKNSEGLKEIIFVSFIFI